VCMCVCACVHQVEKEAARVLAMRTSDSAKQKLQDNIMEGFGAAGGASTAAAISPDSALMMAPEAERLVEGLRTFGESHTPLSPRT
jgi:hypothetical protein